MHFHPIVVGALYPGITRGLSADLLAAQALSGTAYPVCTSHVVAGDGLVTDVLDVPTDTVSAQLEHIFETRRPSSAKVGIIGATPTVDRVFDHLRSLEGPVVYDLTVSGPSGEDILEQQGLEAIIEHLSEPDLVTIRRTDAALVAGMEIPSLDDAQVAAQRIAQQGADHVLVRCGKLPTHFYEQEGSPPDYALDLFFDGDDFALFEAPYLDNLESHHGASSGLLLPLLHHLQAGVDLEPALQKAKGRVSEALRARQQDEGGNPDATFFATLQEEPTTAEVQD
ncbi:bifunctional hydroxymethylpyrimidine kinase/phosphomethylpyrimidine kinase [Salinibacter altiplanensis]|uniref:bifunctional hydroxymethylpyrimidine kinase/phosphomethylpyrimidine kinase n=1 Tax=Salinibacter altiplanensis TaxID=1803181 RepID=UPI000C9FECF4|nr:bifunctional hydroxymethylpyrimidine kinase/phosphomethylpyrimidine kinase [Salinibacter altiplanensis]